MIWRNKTPHPETKVNYLLIRGVLFCLLSLTPATLWSEYRQFGAGSDPNFEGVILKGTRRVNGTDSTRDIKLTISRGQADPATELLLRFDGANPDTLRETTAGYQINESSYRPVGGKRAISGRAAFFYGGKSRVVIFPPGRSLFRDQEQQGGSFSLDFWIQPTHRVPNGLIFRRTGFSGGQEKGLQVSLRQNRLHVEAPGFFSGLTNQDIYSGIPNQSNQGQPNLNLVSDPLPLRDWTHVAISFRARTGKLSVFLNGRESDAVFATSDGTPRGVPLRWSFGNHSPDPLIIGENLKAVLDEFRLSNRALDSPDGHGPRVRTTPYPGARVNYHNKHISQDRGEVWSPVFKTRYSRSWPLYLSWEAVKPPGTHLFLEVRLSDRPFSPDVSGQTLPWQKVSQGETGLPRFQYLQWRAVFQASPDGQRSPILKSVSLNYQNGKPPARPRNLRVVATYPESGRILLEWDRNLARPGLPAQKKFNYILYYGYKPGEYLGRVRYNLLADGNRVSIGTASAAPVWKDERGRWLVRSKLLTNAEIKQLRRKPHLKVKLRNKIRLLVDNALTRAQDRRSTVSANTNPDIQPDRPIYFAVTAVDEEYQRGYADHESEHSNEVEALLERPSVFRPRRGVSRLFLKGDPP